MIAVGKFFRYPFRNTIVKETTMTELTIADYQKAVDKWVQKFGVRYFSELTQPKNMEV